MTAKHVRFAVRAALIAAVLAATAVLPADASVVAGNTWYSDGTTDKSGGPGTVIQAFGTGAIQGVPYQLVLGNDGGDPGFASHACQAVVQVLNPTVVSANRRGTLPMTTGRVGFVPPGTYQLCFRDSSGNASTGTGGATFTVI